MAGNASFEEPIETPDGIRLNTFARRDTLSRQSAGFPLGRSGAAPQKVNKRERFGQSFIATDISCSCGSCRRQILERRFRSCANANESCIFQGSQPGRSQTSQGKWPKCKRSAKKFGKLKPEERCTDRLTQPPVQFESRRSACQFSTAQSASAAVCLDQPRFLMGGRDFGILEKLLGMAGVLSMARFACRDYHDRVVSIEAQARSSQQSILPQGPPQFFRGAPKVRRWIMRSKCFVSL
jgi:hypothetical protein